MRTEAAESYEQQVGVRLGGVPLRFVRRPVASAPPDATHAIVDDGPRTGTATHRAPAIFINGKWVGVKWEPTHWMVPSD